MRLPSLKLFTFLKKMQGFEPGAIIDGEIPMIGYGTTEYPDGTFVEIDDSCTEEKASEWLAHEISRKAVELNRLGLPKSLRQNQFEMLLSLAHTEGVEPIRDSLLIRKLIANPFDESIFVYNKLRPERSCEFLKFIYSGGKISRKLIVRRIQEAKYYIS